MADDNRDRDHHDHGHHDGHNPDWAARMERLDDTGRLSSQVSDADLARLLSLSGDEDVIDLGSGTGFYTDRIAALTTGKVYALEIVPEMLAHHRERGLPANVHLVHGDMTSLSDETPLPLPGAIQAPDLAPQSIDVAVTLATWHEIDGQLDLPAVARLLRPGGRLVIIDWHKEPATWDYGPPENLRFSADEVTAALAGRFRLLSVENVGPSMFAVTAQRV